MTLRHKGKQSLKNREFRPQQIGGNLRVDLEFFSSEARWKLPRNKCQDPELFTKMKYLDNKIHGKKKKSTSQNDTRESTS